MQPVAEKEPESLAPKLTLPDGDTPVTLAVHVLALPTTTGLGVHATLVVLDDWLMSSPVMPDDGALFVSPPYDAVIVCDAGNADAGV